MRVASLLKAVGKAPYRTRPLAKRSEYLASAITMAEGVTEEPEILLNVKDSIAFVTLNRPRALNSLNLGMVHRLLSINQEFSQPGSKVACVVVRGSGGKAFCAGGDVKEVVMRARDGAWSYGSAFFRAEYVNNATIAQLPVPYIAVIDGIVMGGGVGVSYHGSFRVATERTVLAMPESGIGLFPDIGASYFLHRLPGYLGRYMGLTGQRLTGAEVKDAGFATHFIPSSRLLDLEGGILELGSSAADPTKVDSLLRSLEQPPASGSGRSALLEWKLPLINAHFGLGSVGQVMTSLQAAVDTADSGSGSGSESEAARAFLRDTLTAMRRGSPLSHAVTWEMLRRSAAGHLTLQQCLQMEFWLARRFVAGEADFLEGVRALLIDKDNKPRWRYSNVKEVPGVVVQRLFEPLPDEPPLFSGFMAATATGAHISRM